MKEVTEAFWIHMNSAGGHENSATGYVVLERPLFELSTA